MQESSKKTPRAHLFPVGDIPPTVGEAIAAARRRRRWSQQRLAERAGIARATVYRLEACRRPSTADTLFRVAHALGLDMKDLVAAWTEWEMFDHPGHGPRTRERRRSLGMSIAELAAVAGVSEATLSRHERGIGNSPALVTGDWERQVACNEALAKALGFAGVDEFDQYCRTT